MLTTPAGPKQRLANQGPVETEEMQSICIGVIYGIISGSHIGIMEKKMET